MTLQDFLRRYLGWCPRFKEDVVFISPQYSPSLTGKVVVSAILASWAALSALKGIQAVTFFIIRNDLDATTMVRAYGLSITEAIAGIISVILVLTYLTSIEITRRHRILFTSILATLTFHQLIYTAFDLYFFPRPTVFASLLLANQLNITLNLVEGVLSLAMVSYVFLRSAKEKPILDKNLFALLTVYFIFSIFTMDAYTLYIDRVRAPDILLTVNYWVNVTARNIYYGIAAVYSLWVYRRLRANGIHEISPSKLLRAAFLIYGLSGLTYEAWWIISIPNYFGRLFEPGFGAYWKFVSTILYYCAFSALAFVSLKVSVGEPSSKELEI